MINKPLNRLGAWLETRLREMFGRMTPERRLALVVVMFILFSLLSLTMIASAIYHYGKKEGRLNIEHIEGIQVKQSNDSQNGKQK